MTDTSRPKILLVDDEKPILDALYRFCRQRKWQAIRANSGAEGLTQLDEQPVDIIISDMRMPNMDGAEFLKKAKDKMPRAVRILLTGYADMEAVISAVNEAKIYNYLNKPWDDNMLESVINSALDFKQKEDERLRLVDEIAEKNKQLNAINDSLEEKVQERTEKLQIAFQEIQETNKKVTNNFRESLSLMTNIIEMQDGSKANYSNMVANASITIAKTLALSPKEIEQVRIAALLHNIGKLSLPEVIRKKPMNSLNKMEAEVFSTHPIQGEAVLSGMTGLKKVAKLVRSHSEYLNGKGFPDKLRDEQIPMGAKIICVTSDFQKLESNLLIKEISGPEASIEYLLEHSGKLYDARVVDLFEQYYNKHLQNYRSHLSQLALADLQENMILAENLISSNGLLLLTKDTHLTMEHIQQLKKYEIDIGSTLIFPILSTSIDEINHLASQ
ncbi:MAG: response regulator [Cellvibrionaceae bacterium]|nr:response regulator [Cellvibrionaceae bacterium]